MSQKVNSLGSCIIAIVSGIAIIVGGYYLTEGSSFLFKSKNNTITNKSAGGIKLGMTMEEVLQIYNPSNGHTITSHKGMENSCDRDVTYIYEKKTNEHLFSLFSFNNWTSISEIEVHSSKLSTGNGIHPGMSLSDFFKVYLNEYKLYFDEASGEEYFRPFDLNTKDYSVCFVVRSNVVEEYFESEDGEMPIYKDLGHMYEKDEEDYDEYNHILYAVEFDKEGIIEYITITDNRMVEEKRLETLGIAK